MINLPPGFWPIFGPLGPTAGPGSLGTGSGSKHSAGTCKNQPRRSIISQFVGTLCFWCRPQTHKKINDKYEAPQGQPRQPAHVEHLSAPEIIGARLPQGPDPMVPDDPGPPKVSLSDFRTFRYWYPRGLRLLGYQYQKSRRSDTGTSEGPGSFGNHRIRALGHPFPYDFEC